MLKRLSLLLESIKFAHSVFALPFALVAMIVAAGGLPPARIVALIIVCMVCARSAAMAFNRYTDRELDARNPRTRLRPTVTGVVSPKFLVGFTLVCIACFWTAAWFLNTACFVCALPVLAVLLGYSFSKRFTSLCHFWLGLALGLAPVGAHLAVRGNFAPLAGLGARWGLSFELFPWLMTFTVVIWVAGFDIVYACQDYAVDCADARLHSLPKRLGMPAALRAARLLHLLAVVALAALGIYAGMGLWYFLAVGLTGGLLFYEHWIVRPDDLSRVNMAFFTLNGAVSLVLLGAVIIERVVLPRLIP